MNTFQRVIKYLAIAFAIFLTVTILTGIVGLISSIFGVVKWSDEKRTDYSMDYSGIERLDIKHRVGKLIIKPGKGFRVEATNVSESFRTKEVNGTLIIDEPFFVGRFLWFNFGYADNKSVITVYVPENFTADSIKIDSGVGEVHLEKLTADRLTINAGVGDIYGNNLTAKKVNIDGGIGSMKLTDIDFSNVDLESGIGDISIEGIIEGKTEIDCGIGSISLNLNASREDYILRADTGLGNVKVNGRKLNRKHYDNYLADNIIRIDGGIGDVNINFYY
ncbi:MAG TPA: DUF4097 domain-containing protein [Clostridiales bacterium]|jgi:hypothetical protein|nr:DUF4097 domain-containing protein [Clostridiales bacterium]